MAYAGRLSKVSITGDAVAFTAEATTSADDKIYTITDSDKTILDKDTPTIIYDGGVETVDEYELNKLKGEVIFATSDAGRVITIDGAYLPRVVVADAHEYSLSINSNNIDVTRFQDEFVTRIAGIKSASATLSEFWNVDQTLLKHLINGNIIVLDLIPNTDTPGRYSRMYSEIVSDELSSTPADVVGMSINFESTDEMISV